MAVDADKLIPKFVWVIDVPERSADLARRWHNKYAKEALRETIEKWHGHERGFKKHYRRDARQRYRHWPRTPRYLKYKQRKFKSTVDQVLTGRSRRKMTSEWRIRLGGSAEGKNLSGTLILRFPFKGGTGRFRHANTHQAVTIDRLIIELQRFDEEDPGLLANWFLEAYMKKVNAHRAGRKRIRVS
jgi:hypothetical protein